MEKQNLIAMGDAIAKRIRDERQATYDFVNEVQVFLITLPEDLNRDSLNTARAQLLRKCEQYFCG